MRPPCVPYVLMHPNIYRIILGGEKKQQIVQGGLAENMYSK